MNEKTKTKQKILILGAGFGGIKAALDLASSPHFDITLLSDQDNFRYYPALYNIAVGKSHVGASIPLAEIFKGKNVKIVKASAQILDKDGKTVKDINGNIYSYDQLIIALGVVTNFFGISGLAQYAYGIKTLEEAQRLRDHLHKQLVDEKGPDLNYIIIGGGPTGLELAGSLPGYIKHIMKMHGIKERAVRVDLVEAAPRLVPRMPESYSKAVTKHLQKLGVNLLIGQTVQAETADALMVAGQPISSHTVVWTAGVTNHPFLKSNNLALTDKGKAVVDEHLRSEQGIYIIGDNANTEYSGMAQTALYDGMFVAKNLEAEAEGKTMQPYKAKKPVYVIPSGPGWAAVLWGKIQLYGWTGWLLREAADLKGYSDYEPWWKASKHWMALEENEEACPVCMPKAA
jgi:NADH dehydrogenase